MLAYHILSDTWFSGRGNEYNWKEGDVREVNPTSIKACIWGYHSAENLPNCLEYQPSTARHVACLVEIPDLLEEDHEYWDAFSRNDEHHTHKHMDNSFASLKFCSSRRKLLAGIPMEEFIDNYINVCLNKLLVLLRTELLTKEDLMSIRSRIGNARSKIKYAYGTYAYYKAIDGLMASLQKTKMPKYLWESAGFRITRGTYYSRYTMSDLLGPLEEALKERYVSLKTNKNISNLVADEVPI
jgi:hypothetical protein